MCIIIKVLFRAVFGLSALGLLLSPAAAGAAQGPISQWASFTVADGLQSGNILAIMSAQDGALWIGADAGAGRYDGAWQWFSEAQGLPPGKVRAIVQTKDGALWFATSAGLAQMPADGRCCTIWTQARGLPADDVLSLALDATNNGVQGVWVGTTKGLAYVGEQGVDRVSGLPDGAILALEIAPEGQLLATVQGQGVWRRGEDGRWTDLGGGDLVAGDLYALLADEDGILWVGTPSGLVRLRAGTWERFPLSADDMGMPVLAIARDPIGGLWAGTDRGVFHDPDAQPGGLAVEHLRAQQDGLVNDYVRTMLIDRDHALWLGTISGVNRYTGIIWHVVPDAAVRNYRINTALVDHKGYVWAGTEGNGLAVWDGQRWQRFSARDGLPDDRVVALFEDAAGYIWVATNTAVGYVAQAAPWQFERLQTPDFVRLPAFAFEQDAQGGLWLATDGGAVRWTEAGGFERVVELEGQRVNAVYQARDGVLWFGTRSAGVLRRVEGQWQSLADASPARLNDIIVNGIGETDDGALWVGTYNDGLWRYVQGRWERMDMNLPTPKLLSLVTGAGLWVGTRQGLTRYDGVTWQSYTGDVLPGAWVTTLATGSAGAVWIGTTTGLAQYRPETTPPWVEIVSVNLQSPQANDIRLDNNRLQILHVRGGDLGTQARDLVYLTQLYGVDAAPQVHTDPQITAYNTRTLASGAYVLRVIARDSALNYSQPAEINIIVPDFVRLPGGRMIRTDVFYPLLALGVLAIVGVGASSGMGLRARARARALTEETTKRQREALARAFNPYISGEPIRHTDMFFGRDELVRRIFNALHQNSIMIHGERRMGKTTLLYQLAEQLRQADDPEWVFVPVYIDLEGTPEEHFFHHLMDAIWGALQGYLTDETFDPRFQHEAPETYSDRDFAADLRGLLDRLKDVVAPRKFRVIMLMDEMDVVSSYNTLVQQQLRRIFMSSLATNLGAVVAGIHISKAWDRLESPWYNLFNEIALEPFPADEARKLLIEPVRGVYEWEPAALEYVIHQAGGRPYRLQQYALEAVNLMLAADRLRITQADVLAAHEIVERNYGS